jgi:hypothetical protein
MRSMRLSPTTTTPRADACKPMPEKFDTDMKTGLTTLPTMMRITTTGRSATSLTKDTALAWRLICCSATSAATLLLASVPGLSGISGVGVVSLSPLT